MKLLKTHYHPDVENLDNKSVFTRLSSRGIAMHGDDILLLYTKRYDDYSLPGGGLELEEDKVKGMIREVQEETGAQNISNIQSFGIYEEYRPWHKPDYDIQHMISYCYTCDINKELSKAELESHEISNGMSALWINIHEAITHNKNTIASSNKKGLSIERETFLLELVVKKRDQNKSTNSTFTPKTNEQLNAEDPKRKKRRQATPEELNHPLHGVKLKEILERLVDRYGWEGLAQKVNIRCFKYNPNMKSSIGFLRKTRWAREYVEDVYMDMLEEDQKNTPCE